jgi:hypothetical protein
MVRLLDPLPKGADLQQPAQDQVVPVPDLEPDALHASNAASAAMKRVPFAGIALGCS